MRTQAVPVQRADSPFKVANAEQSMVAQQGPRFQYIGKTAMTAIGLISGRQYRFGSPGAILEVDPRDMASLAAIANLRQVQGALL